MKAELNFLHNLSGLHQSNQSYEQLNQQPIAKLARAIASQEACYSWNNPGCLIYARQAQSTRNLRGFAAFSNRAAGWKALLRDIGAKRKRGLTDLDIIQMWNQNPSKDYIERIRGQLNASN